MDIDLGKAVISLSSLITLRSTFGQFDMKNPKSKKIMILIIDFLEKQFVR